eukprot:14893-Heterococcus_DN1.PRE.3
MECALNTLAARRKRDCSYHTGFAASALASMISSYYHLKIINCDEAIVVCVVHCRSSTHETHWIAIDGVSSSSSSSGAHPYGALATLSLHVCHPQQQHYHSQTIDKRVTTALQHPHCNEQHYKTCSSILVGDCNSAHTVQSESRSLLSSSCCLPSAAATNSVKHTSCELLRSKPAKIVSICTASNACSATAKQWWSHKQYQCNIACARHRNAHTTQVAHYAFSSSDDKKSLLHMSSRCLLLLLCAIAI